MGLKVNDNKINYEKMKKKSYIEFKIPENGGRR